jgi:prepilin signal peptidase PulO-like enzyme (type II secretory pathway)
MVVSGGGRKTKIPFGPFLAAGAVLSIVWGTPAAHALFHHLRLGSSSTARRHR